MSGCVQNIINTMFSADLQFCESSSFRCLGEGFGLHFGRLLATMGSLFLIFEGTRKMSEFRRIFDECRRPRYAQARGVGGGVRGIIGAPTSPLGLSPKIEEEKRRS